MTTLFSLGDIIFVPQMCSLQSMVYYGEHKKEIGCPCTWLHAKAQVISIQGNFVHVADLTDPSRKTAFYHQDITLVQRAGAEDG
jgi:hypothetical protein